MGGLDLTQAEAVMDLISAQTSLALRSATEQLDGRLGSERCEEIRAESAWGDCPSSRLLSIFPRRTSTRPLGSALQGTADERVSER